MSQAYVYRSEDGCHTVGYYDPDGKWHAESDHSSPGIAADRVRFLNGGGDVDQDTPPKWEYETVNAQHATLLQKLHQLGAMRWELVAVIHDPMFQTKYIAFLKRRVQ